MLAGHRVERAEGLVHQQHGRVVDQGAGDRHALLHAARELPRIFALEHLEADERQQVHAGLVASLATQTLHVDREQHVVEDRAPGEQDGRLEDDADVAPRTGDERAAQQRLAARRTSWRGDGP